MKANEGSGDFLTSLSVEASMKSMMQRTKQDRLNHRIEANGLSMTRTFRFFCINIEGFPLKDVSGFCNGALSFRFATIQIKSHLVVANVAFVDMWDPSPWVRALSKIT